MNFCGFLFTHDLKSFDMDSVQVGKAVFGKEIHTTLGKRSPYAAHKAEVRSSQ